MPAVEECDVGRKKDKAPAAGAKVPRSSISVPSSEFAKMVSALSEDAGFTKVEDWLVHIGFVPAILDLYATMSERRAKEAKDQFNRLKTEGKSAMDLSKN